MAKDTKKTAGKKGAAAKKGIGASAKDLGFKFGVTDLAERMGLEPASVRVALRREGVANNGSVYGWNSDRELDGVVKQIGRKAAKEDKKATKKEAKGAKKEEKVTRRRRSEEAEENEGEDAR
jgi:hypothetical protein